MEEWGPRRPSSSHNELLIGPVLWGPRAQGNPPASASHMMGLQASTTTSVSMGAQRYSVPQTSPSQILSTGLATIVMWSSLGQNQQINCLKFGMVRLSTFVATWRISGRCSRVLVVFNLKTGRFWRFWLLCFRSCFVSWLPSRSL